MDSLEVGQICGLLTHKIQFLEEVLACSQKLAELDVNDDEKQCSQLLRIREKYLGTLMKLEPTLRNYLQTFKENGGDPAQNQEIALLYAKAEQLTQEILALDKRKIAVISGQMQQVKDKIQSISQGKKGIAGYKNTQVKNTTSVFTDSRR